MCRSASPPRLPPADGPVAPIEDIGEMVPGLSREPAKVRQRLKIAVLAFLPPFGFGQLVQEKILVLDRRKEKLSLHAYPLPYSNFVAPSIAQQQSPAQAAVFWQVSRTRHRFPRGNRPAARASGKRENPRPLSSLKKTDTFQRRETSPAKDRPLPYYFR